jgi:hypothetical protein
MTTVRRRVLRPIASVAVAVDIRRQARMQRQRSELAKSRAALRRWLTRLKRATSTVFALHQRIARLEARLAESS